MLTAISSWVNHSIEWGDGVLGCWEDGVWLIDLKTAVILGNENKLR
jgi:hypothetical protein